MGWSFDKSGVVYAYLMLFGLLSLAACALQPRLEREDFGSAGYFEFHAPQGGVEGVVVGAPHGLSDAGSAELARQISERLGSGLVVAYGFKRKHLAVSQPLFYTRPQPDTPNDPAARGSVFPEYREVLKRAGHGALEFYIGIHRTGANTKAKRLEVVSSGFTFEELEALKKSYQLIHGHLLADQHGFKVPIAITPLDKIAWRAGAIKDHGILMVARKGMILRIPASVATGTEEGPYAQILSAWLSEAVKLVSDDTPRLPQVEVRLLDLGRIELIPSRLTQAGIVIGSPHGSFDQYTAEFVNQMSYQTGLAAVVTRGFTPAEANGWRINVNRPTEKRFTATPVERYSERAARVYQAFKDAVLKASRRALNLYVEVHRYSPGARIQVATSGISREEARLIKTTYKQIRDETLRNNPDFGPVELLIEPLDTVEIRALAAKSQGILALSKKSLHFELPAEPLLNNARARDFYAVILSDLLRRSWPPLVNPH